MDKPKLTIVINPAEPVAIKDINDLLSGINDEFKDFVAQKFKIPKYKVTLFLQEVRKGSLEFDLVDLLPVFAGVGGINALYEFGSHLKNTFLSLLGDQPDKEIGLLNKKSQKNITKILSPIASEQGTQVFITVNGDGNTITIPLTEKEQKEIKKILLRLKMYSH